MDDLKFNIYAFTSPKTAAERAALWEEAFRLMGDLDRQITGIEIALANAQAEPEHAAI